MGAGASTQLKEELQKPSDASDLSTLEEAVAEVVRIRKTFQENMGAGSSSVLQSELKKPVDGSDVTTLEDAKAEVVRIRQLLKEYQAKSEANQFANRISVAIDGSELSHKAFDIAMSVRPSANVHTTVLTVEDKSKDYLPGEMHASSLVEKYNAELASKVGSEDKYEVIVEQKEGTTRDTICKFINSKEMQPMTFLAVGMVGRKGPGKGDKILGSTTDLSMRQGNCATLLVKDSSRVVPENEPADWIVCLDGSQRAEKAAELCNFLKKDSDKVTYLYVLTNEELGKKFAEKYKSLLTIEKVGGTTVADHILQHLSKEETKCDYLVMGADGEEAFKLGKRTIGSVSDRLVKKAECTCLVQSHL
eukprot:g2620.t1